MTDTTDHNPDRPALSPPRRRLSTRLMTSVAIVAVLIVGAVGGAAATRYMHRHWPEAVMLLQPSPIAQLKDRTPVAVKGQVAEVFGNKFIVQDDSGRTLVDTGPRGDSAKPVAKGEAVIVQGRFDNGFIHAQVMTRADGTTEAYGPPHPPHRGPEEGPRGYGPGMGPGMGPGFGPGGPADRAPPPR